MHFLEELQPAQMPQIIQKGLSAAKNLPQGDMLFLSLLTASGYAMPRYFMRSGIPAHRYEPALMTLVVAPPASGKGIMNLSRRLLQPLHDRLRRQTEEALLCADKDEQELIPQEMVFIPGNCSTNALLQLLNDNQGRGFIHETEIDVVSQIWRRDYGNYSTLMRQAFEHETVSKARKTKTDAYLEVKRPVLSVLLSGTAGQLRPLLESRENGLASRFICYVADELIPFDREAILNYTEQTGDQVSLLYDELAASITRMYDWLSSQKGECEWRLSPEQAEYMRGTWEDNYALTLCQMGLPVSFDPVVKRMAVSIQRIGMILSMLRYWEATAEPLLAAGKPAPLPATLDCADSDFASMMAIADVLTYHAIAVHTMLPSEDEALYAVASAEQPDPASELLAALPDSFTTKEALDAGKTLEQAERSVRNYLNKLLDEKKLVKIGHGRYKKV